MKTITLLVMSLAMLLFTSNAQACSVCFGAKDSLLTKGLAWGILSLLGVLSFILVGIVAFFNHLRKAERSSIV